MFFILKNINILADETNLGTHLSVNQLNKNDTFVEGDSLESILDRKLRVTGNASITRGNQSITADFIEYDQISEELYAKGKIKITTPDMELKGSELEMSLAENTGAIANGSFVVKINQPINILDEEINQPINILDEEINQPIGESCKDPTFCQIGPSKFNSQLRGTATQIFLEGEDRKKLENAKITTCEVGQNEWFITSDETIIDESSGKIKAKHATLMLKGVPIMYSPYVDFSTTADRRSGWLLPSVGSTTNTGLEASIPYYFNLSPTQDATLTSRYMEKRGLQFDGEFRYLSKKFTGTSQVQYLNNDKDSDIGTRYLIDIDHKQDFGNGFSGTIEYEKVKRNDNNYFADMSTNIAVTSQVSLRQTANIEYKKTNSLSDIEADLKVQKFQNLADASPYELKPSFNLSYKKEWDNEYLPSFLETDANFSFDQFTNAENAAKNTPKGSRITSTPSVSFPMETSFGFLKPKVIMNLKQYDLENTEISQKNLTIPTLSIDSGIYLDRPFKLSGYNFTQTLEPRVFYTYTPYEDQSDIPMFDTALNEVNASTIFQENQFSGKDRVMDTDAITTALTTRIIDDSGYDWMLLTMAQRFYFADRKVMQEAQFEDSPYKGDKSDFLVNAKANLTKALKVTSNYEYNFSEGITNRFTAGASYAPEPGKILNASYRMVLNPDSRDYDVKQYLVSGQWPIKSGWSALASYNYDMYERHDIEGMLGAEYDAGCWTAQMMFHRLQLATTDEATHTFFLMLEIGDLGSFGQGERSSLFEKMNRTVKGSSFASNLPDEYREKNMEDINIYSDESNQGLYSTNLNDH